MSARTAYSALMLAVLLPLGKVAPATAQNLIRIAVTPPDRSIEVGETKSMTATGTFDDRRIQDLTDYVFWSSDNPAVATVSNESGTRGHTTAVAPGIVFISARLGRISSSDSNEDARVRVPADLLSIHIVPRELRLPVEFSGAFEAEGSFSDGSVADVSEKVVWLISDSSVAAVSNERGSRGLVTAGRRGAANISVVDPQTGISSGDTEGNATVTVPGRVRTIAIRPRNEELTVSGSRKFSADAVIEDGSLFALSRASVDWKSSNERVAVVSNEPSTAGLVTGTAAGEAIISAEHRETRIRSTVNATVHVLGQLISLEVTPHDRRLVLGETKSMTATGTFEDGQTRDLTDEVTWISSDRSVVEVANEAGRRGHVTGVRSGVAFISAVSAGGVFSDEDARVRVSADLVSIRVSPESVRLPVGFTTSVDAIGTFSDGTEDDISNVVTWSVDDPRVATVSNDPESAGDVTALDGGVAFIAAVDPETGISSTDSDGNAVLTAAGRAVGLVVHPDEFRMSLGDTRRFSVRAILDDGSSLDVSRRSVEWMTSDAMILIVSNEVGSSGEATAMGLGETTLFALHQPTGLQSEAVVVRVMGTLLSIAVTPPDRRMDVDQTKSMTAIGTFSDGLRAEITDEVVWTSSDPSVATVSNAPGTRGHVRALGAGVVFVSARGANGISSSDMNLDGRIRVFSQLETIRITPGEVRLVQGFTGSLDAEGSFRDGSVADVTTRVTWSSSDPAIVEVSNATGTQGELLPVGSGVAVISAVDPDTGVASSQTNGDAFVTVAGRVLALSVRPSEDQLPIGLTRRLSVRALLDDGTFFEVLRRNLQWQSADPAIATVNNNSRSAGLVTALAPGDTAISVIHPSTGLSSAASGGNAHIIVPGRMVAIEVRPRNIGLFAGSRETLNAFALLDGGEQLKLTRGIEFASSDGAIATVTNESGIRGETTGHAPGIAAISARHPASGLSSSTTGGDATVMVAGPPESIRIQLKNRQLRTGDQRKLKVFGLSSEFPENSSVPVELEVTDAVEWTSSDPSVIRIDGSQATAVGRGTATISARYSVGRPLSTNLDADVNIRVVADLKAMKIRPRRHRTRVGARRPKTLRVVGVYSDRARIDITDDVEYITADPGVADVINQRSRRGEVVPVGVGRTTVTATHPVTGLRTKRAARIIVKKARSRRKKK